MKPASASHATAGHKVARAAADERDALRLARRRLLPFLFLLYVVAFLDRVNVGFAALQMNRTIGLSAAAYGFGAGVFFVGYAMFEVPSNLILCRVGARRWIARIMLTWGLLSIAMMFVRGPTSFSILRFCLGVAEAGFFPGVIFYLSSWFPVAAKARAIGWFMTAIPLSSVIGGPLAGGLLSMNGRFGLAGWQWIFLVEGIPAVLLAPVVLAYLPDSPDKARWLTTEQRASLSTHIQEERDDCGARHGVGVRAALAHPVVWLLGVSYFLSSAGLYGLILWLPQIIRGFSGLGDFLVGVISALPYVVTAIAMVLVSVRSDRSGERVRYVIVPCYISALGFAISAVLRSPGVGLVALTVAIAAGNSRSGPFWSLPSMFLTGPAAAGGIALINTLGALGGFAGPWIVGIVRGITGSFSGGLLAMAVLLAGSAAVAQALRSSPVIVRAALPLSAAGGPS